MKSFLKRMWEEWKRIAHVIGDFQAHVAHHLLRRAGSALRAAGAPVLGPAPHSPPASRLESSSIGAYGCQLGQETVVSEYLQ